MKNILLLLITLSLSYYCYSEEITIFPSNDMYTDVEHTSESPTQTELWTANFSPAGMFQRIMLNFELADILQNNIETVELNLTRFFSCPTSGSTITRIYPITQEWNESSWDCHTNVEYDTDIYQEVPFIASGGTAINQFHIDITALITDIQDSGLEFHGLVIISNPNQKFSKFYSKEHSNNDYKPSLTLSYSPVPNLVSDIDVPDVEINIYPNPFNPTTTISFANPENRLTSVTIFDLRGRLIKSFSNISTTRGECSITWNGDDNQNKSVSSGIYLSKIAIGSKSLVKKMVLKK